ncbi:MAG: amino acid carrier protein [Defluviitaleaceae bacterium]|nr:amino acid carrier protein [Defluviitaleaceae bacterium]
MEAFLEHFFRRLQGVVWDWPSWAILLGAGLILSIQLNWFQVSKFAYYMDVTLIDMFRKEENKKMPKEGKGDITPFQAVSTALSSTMGVGTIAGTVTAIIVGGPGAVFWMWVVGFFGITTKFCETVLAVHFRTVNEKGEILSGPFAYMEKGLGQKWVAVIFSIFGAMAAFGIGNMVQANSVAGAMYATFGFSRLWVGIVAAVIIAAILIGGIKSIGRAVGVIIPFMAIAILMLSFLIIGQYLTAVPRAFYDIVTNAFSISGAIGGVAGAGIMYAMRLGLQRGVFSNEAGLGSAPIGYAAAQTDHPVKQGFWAAFEVFLDTHVVCTVVALVVLVTVPMAIINPGSGDWTGSGLLIYAYNQSFLGEFGGQAMSVILALFGFSTVLGWAFYGEKCVEYLVGSTKMNLFYRMLAPLALVFGATGGTDLVWAMADTMNAFMALPNIVTVLLLSKVVKKVYANYFNKNESYEPFDQAAFDQF